MLKLESHSGQWLIHELSERVPRRVQRTNVASLMVLFEYFLNIAFIAPSGVYKVGNKQKLQDLFSTLRTVKQVTSPFLFAC